jgi:hypothetical protein
MVEASTDSCPSARRQTAVHSIRPGVNRVCGKVPGAVPASDARRRTFQAFNIGGTASATRPVHAAQHGKRSHPTSGRRGNPICDPHSSATSLGRVGADLDRDLRGVRGPDSWFRPFVDRSATTMGAIRYERRAGQDDPLPGQQRMGRTPTTALSRSCRRSPWPVCRSSVPMASGST